jgi:hypothetical protein
MAFFLPDPDRQLLAPERQIFHIFKLNFFSDYKAERIGIVLDGNDPETPFTKITDFLIGLEFLGFLDFLDDTVKMYRFVVLERIDG